MLKRPATLVCTVASTFASLMPCSTRLEAAAFQAGAKDLQCPHHCVEARASEATRRDSALCPRAAAPYWAVPQPVASARTHRRVELNGLFTGRAACQKSCARHAQQKARAEAFSEEAPAHPGGYTQWRCPRTHHDLLVVDDLVKIAVRQHEHVAVILILGPRRKRTRQQQCQQHCATAQPGATHHGETGELESAIFDRDQKSTPRCGLAPAQGLQGKQTARLVWSLRAPPRRRHEWAPGCAVPCWACVLHRWRCGWSMLSRHRCAPI